MTQLIDMKYIKKINEGYFPKLTKSSAEKSSEEKLANVAKDAIKNKILNYLKYLLNEYTIFNNRDGYEMRDKFGVQKVYWQGHFIDEIQNVFTPELYLLRTKRPVRDAKVIIKDITITTKNDEPFIKVDLCIQILGNTQENEVRFAATSYNHLLNKRNINKEWKEALDLSLQCEEKQTYDNNKKQCIEYLKNAKVLIDKIYIDFDAGTDFVTHENDALTSGFAAYYDPNRLCWVDTTREEYVALIGKKFIFPNNKYNLVADVKVNVNSDDDYSFKKFSSYKMFAKIGYPDFGKDLDTFILDYIKNSDKLDDIDKMDIMSERKNYTPKRSSWEMGYNSHDLSYTLYLHEEFSVSNGIGKTSGPTVDITNITLNDKGLSIDCRKENGKYDIVCIYTKYGLQYDEHGFNDMNFLDIIQKERPDLIQYIIKLINIAEKDFFKFYFTNEKYV